MSNIMVDLETFDTGSNAAIVSIGAVHFNSKGLGEEFYAVIDLNTSVKAGLTLNPDTIMWWMQQSDDARAALASADKDSLFNALKAFSKFVGPKSKAKIWGNGATFDNVILANAYKAVNLELPWNFWNDMCYRTVKNLLGSNVPFERVGELHNALDDAKTQAEHLVKILALFK